MADTRRYDRGDRPDVWSCREIVEYTDSYGATFVGTGDALAIQFPKIVYDRYHNVANRAFVIAQVLPHMKARRAELIEYFTPFDPDEGDGSAPDDVIDELDQVHSARLKAIRDLVARASGAKKKVYQLTPPDPLPAVVDAKWIANTVVYLAVEGDGAWVKLPGTVPLPVPEKKKPKAKFWYG